MKVVPFKVPQTRKQAFRVQKERLPHFYDKLHQHHEIQLMWILESEGTLIAGDYVGRFEPGDLYIVGSGQPHVFRNDNIDEHSISLNAASLSIYFDESYLGENFWMLEEMESIRKFLKESSRGFKILGNTRNKVQTLLDEMVKMQGLDRIVIFLQALQQLAGSTELQPLSVIAPLESYSQSEGKRMNDILHFTFQQSHRKIYIDEVARLAHLSVEAFCRYFKTRTGKTYTNFLNEVRISNACKMMINKELSIQDVCYKCGFSNLSNFNRAFKKITGKTPSRYVD